MLNITVIIPTHNRLHTLPRAIDSVLNQSVAVNEIIVVDDGSSDGTGAYVHQYYPQVQLLQQERRGVSAARNTGIVSAKGEWLALLDSDDEWLPHKIAQQQKVLMENPDFNICHTEEIWIRNGKRVNAMHKHKKYGGWIYPHCLPLCAMSPSSILFNRFVLDDVGLFDESLPACEDYDLWLRICNRYPVLFVEDPCIVKYGGHDDQLSRKYWGMDRFRIQALVKMLESNETSQNNRSSTINTLLSKVTVYLNGAEKRGKQDEVAYYKALLAKYTQAEA